MLRLLRGLARGSVAWAAGYLVTMLLLIADLAGAGSKPLRDAGPLYLEAHALGVSVDPRYVVAVPVVVLAIVGYQTGRRSGKGSRAASGRSPGPSAARIEVDFAGPRPPPGGSPSVTRSSRRWRRSWWADPSMPQSARSSMPSSSALQPPPWARPTSASTYRPSTAASTSSCGTGWIHSSVSQAYRTTPSASRTNTALRAVFVPAIPSRSTRIP